MIKISSARKKALIYSLAIAITSVLSGCGGGNAETKTVSPVVDPSQPVSDWRMVWNDEFDGTSIDRNKWTHEVNCDGGGNQEQQCYTADPANSFVADGLLNIVATPTPEPAEGERKLPLPYTSARLSTVEAQSWTYGRFEMRAKLPQGQGAWPAFWMLPTDNVYGIWPQSGEIDILEAVNLKANAASDVPEANVFGTLHYGENPENDRFTGRSYLLPGGENPADDFHTYAVEWQEGEIRWYVDNVHYATQRQSVLRFNSRGEAVGLRHRGWYTEFFDSASGQKIPSWSTAPFDVNFYLILNFAVGGNFPEGLNEGGINADAFGGDNTYQIDYVRVFECQVNPDTGKGCDTVGPTGQLVAGKAPIPVPPSDGIPRDLVIFDDETKENTNWRANGFESEDPVFITDEERGEVVQFSLGSEPSVAGFLSRATIDEEGFIAKPFDASPIINTGTISFDMKLITPPISGTQNWFLKLESDESNNSAELNLNLSNEGVAPPVGEWQTYTFPLNAFDNGRLIFSAIDVVLIFPEWAQGDGAVYQITDVKFDKGVDAPASNSVSLTIFENAEDPNWPLWDCCGGTTPTVILDEDASHGNVAEFNVGAQNAVNGFNTRIGATPSTFDATSILSNGVVQFDMKVIAMPNNETAEWFFKIEAAGGGLGNPEKEKELLLTASMEGMEPALDQWQTYTFKLSDIAADGLDVSALDIVLVFPSFDRGEGAIYRVDNVKIYDPNASSDFNGEVLFDEAARDGWAVWDCCSGSTPELINDSTEHGMVAQYTFNDIATVMGLQADNADLSAGTDGVFLDASRLIATGVVEFEVKVTSAPIDAEAQWFFKIESNDAVEAVELLLSASNEGVEPVVDQWQTYTYTLQSLVDAGLDASAIDIFAVFPTYTKGNGASYRLDNVRIYDPSTVPSPSTSARGITIFNDAADANWPLWDCCADSTPTVINDGDNGAVAEFVFEQSAGTVVGFNTRLGVEPSPFDASSLVSDGFVRFDLKVTSMPNDTTANWNFKIEAAGGGEGNVEKEKTVLLSDSVEGVSPTLDQWQTYTFNLTDLTADGLDASAIDILMVFPDWGKAQGASFLIDNVVISAP